MIVQIDFSAVFDSVNLDVNHQRIRYKLCFVVIVGSMLAEHELSTVLTAYDNINFVL